MEISIIIPAYNANETIGNTVRSILNSADESQSFEVIVIDDGSKQPLEDVLVALFPREIKSGLVKYFYQNNSGVSAARNNGLSKATGNYITFCDADDMVSDDYLSSLLKLISTTPDADIFEFRLKTYVGSVDNITGSNQVTVSNEGLHGHDEALNNATQSFMWLVMCRLIKSSLAKSVEFPVGIKYCEDLIYLYQLYEKSKHVYSSNLNLYRYQMGHVSAISKVTLADCDFIDKFLSSKEIKDKKTHLCLRAHLFYMYHSAAKRNLGILEFSKIVWQKKISALNWVKLYRLGAISKRKCLVGVLPHLYFLVFRLKN